MRELSTATLQTSEGAEVALKGVWVNAELSELSSQVSIVHTYKNNETNNIEAVYTFPLTVDAVLLDFSVTIGNKILKGIVVEKKQAEEEYEDAITEGDTAILLEETATGMLTLNVGNILAGETISIEISYGILHNYQANKSLRFMLPTAIAPRYGNPLITSFEPHQVPEYSLSCDYCFSLNLTVKGLLTNAEIESPTHNVLIDEQDQQTFITLAAEVMAMDRDFVLNFNSQLKQSGVARVERDHQGYVALASFPCDFELADDKSTKSYKIIVDCSGSMQGDSIKQAKKALLRIVENCQDGDYINIIKFGTKVEMLSETQLCINTENRHKVILYIQHLQADMGGTEMDKALKATYSISENMEMPHDILLITDGEVWGDVSTSMFDTAMASRHRIFTIGVGSSVAEDVVRELADVTNGACELVSPNEAMGNKIYRHFKRINSPRAKQVDINWPILPKTSYYENYQPVFAGDSLHVFAWFDEVPQGDVELIIHLSDGNTVVEKITCQELTTASQDYYIARMGAANKIRYELNNDESSRLTIALQYQLMSPLTSYLVVHERDESETADGLPELRIVPQTVAAGWNGLGTVSTDSFVHDHLSRGFFEDNSSAYCGSLNFDQFDSPESLCDEHDLLEENELIDAIRILDKLYATNNYSYLNTISLDVMKTKGMPLMIINSLKNLIDTGYKERVVILLFLYYLSQSSFKEYFNNSFSKTLTGHKKQLSRDDQLLAKVRSLLGYILPAKVSY